MTGHLIASALARLGRAPFTAAANLLALALGLACFLGAYGASVYWRSGDAYQESAARTYVVGQALQAPPGSSAASLFSGRLNLSSTATLARYIRQDIPELQHVARVFRAEETSVSAGNVKFTVRAAFAEPEFLDIFAFDFVAGDPGRALSQPGGIILTQSAAQRLFGAKPALGQAILVDNKWTGTVTGVIAPIRQPSFMGEGEESVLSFEMMGAWSSSPAGLARDQKEAWLNASAYTFVVLPASMAVSNFNDRLNDLLAKRVPTAQSQMVKITAAALPLSTMATRGFDNMLEAQTGLQISAASILLVLGAIALAVAAANYANLATAHASTRTKEIGMRRVVGATSFAIMLQSWLEALILTSIAFMASLGILALVAPIIRSSAGIDILYFLTHDYLSWAVAAAIVLAVALIAGAYPAFVLAHIRPAEALQSGRSRTGPRFVASLLVVIQFASASFLLILVTVAQFQRVHLEQSVLAPREDPIIVTGDLAPAGVDFSTLQTRLAVQPSVKQASIVDIAPWSNGASVTRLARTPEDAANASVAYTKMVGGDYFGAMSLELVAGRGFAADRDATPSLSTPNDTSQPRSIIVDAILAQEMGYATPQAAIDQIVYSAGAAPARPMRIVGVVEADMMRLTGVSGDMAGTAYSYYPVFPPSAPRRAVIRIAGRDVASAVASITRTWDQLAPNTPVRIQFFDQLFEQSYRQQARTGQIFMMLGLVCFVIASVGLLGIAVHVASRRRHEVAIRKTLGSSAMGVIRLLLTDFSKPVFIGNLLAWPVGYLAAQAYLKAFAYRIDLTLTPFLLSLAITLLIAWAAVAGVVVKTASLHPAEVLRHA